MAITMTIAGITSRGHLASRGFAHELDDSCSYGTCYHRGCDEDQYCNDDVRQIGQYVVHESRESGDFQRSNRGEQEEREHDVEDHGGDPVGGTGTGDDLVDVAACL
ncbi:MAG: hypothetical protein WKF73_15240 [Nocardioidaceae bacterium]